MAVAAALMGGCLPAGSGAGRLLLLVGGACTEGSGKVVDKDLSEPIRCVRCWRCATPTPRPRFASLRAHPRRAAVLACPHAALFSSHPHPQQRSNSSHKDLAKDAAPYYRKAKKFYDGIAAQLVAQGHSMDLFACSLDQVGAAPAGRCRRAGASRSAALGSRMARLYAAGLCSMGPMCAWQHVCCA